MDIYDILFNWYTVFILALFGTISYIIDKKFYGPHILASFYLCCIFTGWFAGWWALILSLVVVLLLGWMEGWREPEFTRYSRPETLTVIRDDGRIETWTKDR
jgi:hypothetical protein